MDEKQLDILLSNVLRVGLSAAALLSMVGCVMFFSDFTGGDPTLQKFQAQPQALRSIPGIWNLALQGDPDGLMQLAVLILLATPFLRVIFACYGFICRREWKFVMISIIVLSALFYGLYA